MRTSPARPGGHALVSGLVVIAAIAAGVALFAACGGRVFLPIGPFPLSIRNPRNPTVIACGAALLAWMLAPDRVRGLGARFAAAASRAATPAALLLSLVIGALAVQYGAFVAGGADSSGYLSQARQWRAWTFHHSHPLAALVEWSDEPRAFTPLGYRPATTAGADVPLYPPGLPMAMALAQAIGGDRATFLIVPICAAGTVLLTFLIGRRIGGVATALFATALVAVSPIFLFQAMQQMSDVPAAFLWTLVFALLMRGAAWPTLAAGLAAGMAGLVRPNLWVVVAATVPLIAWWRPAGESARARVACFVAGLAAPAALFLAWNVALYGSPFETGYGPNGEMLAWAHVRPNIERYSSWMLDLQGPIVLLAVAAPIVAALTSGRSSAGAGPDTRALWSALAMCVVLQGFFLFYLVFDSWPSLRFVLPTLPLAFVLVALVLTRLLALVPQPAQAVAGFALLVAIVGAGMERSITVGVFHTAQDASRYEVASTAAARRMAPDAVVFSMLHSGSVSYYTGRAIARWDAVPAGALARYAADLRVLGRSAYLLLDDLERPDFDPLHGAELARARDLPFEWLVEPPVGVRLYDLSALAAPSR